MIVLIGENIQSGLFACSLPISNSILKIHNGGEHVDHHNLSNGRLERLIVVIHPGKLRCEPSECEPGNSNLPLRGT